MDHGFRSPGRVRFVKSFVITTLGCRVNQFESETLGEVLECSGLAPSFSDGGADVCIINTCAVTSRAAMQSRQAVRRMIRSHPGARILVTGCNAQIAFDEMAAIPGVHAVIRPSEKERIPDLIFGTIHERTNGNERTDSCREAVRRGGFPAAWGLHRRARPYLKIQDGCNACCTYCIIPRARGANRSLPPEAVFEALRRFRAAGYPEVVLTGIHLGSYGQDLPSPMDLLDLLVRIEASNTVERIRLSSIEPMEMTDALITFAAGSKNRKTRICPHFHLPLQNGDNATLERMGRPYTPEMYRIRVEAILSAIPDAAVGADVMAAFPGETDAAFERSLAFIETLPLAYLHVFPFSPRPGTPAARFEDPVDSRTAKSRCRRLRELGGRKRKRFYEKAVGSPVDLVMEPEAAHRKGYCRGISETYIPVWLKIDACNTERRVAARIDRVDASLAVFGTTEKVLRPQP